MSYLVAIIAKSLWLGQERAQNFSLGEATPKGLSPRAGFGFFGEGAATPSHQSGGLGSSLSSPQRFSTISAALRVASPDIIILLSVDYHASTMGELPLPSPPLRMPLDWYNLAKTVNSAYLLVIVFSRILNDVGLKSK